MLLYIIDFVKIILHYSSNESIQRYIYSRRWSARKRGFGGPPWFSCSPRENKQKRQAVLASTWQTTARYIRAIRFSRGRPQQIQIHRVPKRRSSRSDRLPIVVQFFAVALSDMPQTIHEIFNQGELQGSSQPCGCYTEILIFRYTLILRSWLIIMPL